MTERNSTEPTAARPHSPEVLGTHPRRVDADGLDGRFARLCSLNCLDAEPLHPLGRRWKEPEKRRSWGISARIRRAGAEDAGTVTMMRRRILSAPIARAWRGVLRHRRTKGGDRNRPRLEAPVVWTGNAAFPDAVRDLQLYAAALLGSHRMLSALLLSRRIRNDW